MVGTPVAARIYGVSKSHIRRLGISGELIKVVESPRVVYWDLEQVKALAKEKAAVRKKRGGRPPSKAAG